MRNKRVRRIALGLSGLAIGWALLPALSRANLDRQAAISPAPAAVLGVTPAKVPAVMPMSVRDPAFSAAIARDATGDTYGAAGLVQDALGAYFVDDEPDTHTFGTGEESAGLGFLSQVDTRIIGSDFGPGVPGTNFLQVNYFTVDASDIVPLGSVGPDGSFFEAWRFDVGSVAVGSDQISWTPTRDSPWWTPDFACLTTVWRLVVSRSRPMKAAPTASRVSVLWGWAATTSPDTAWTKWRCTGKSN
ncbi:MAG: hypothetical protein IH987_11890 [Planctomycetes bacterium]|nr:hypothetical protein [Planctomycetota bacterium]